MFLALSSSATLCGDDQVARYREQIKSLDAQRPESVCQARATLRDWMPSAEPVDRAAMFREFRAFYLDAIRASDGLLEEALEPIQNELLNWMQQGQSVQAVRQRIDSRPEVRGVTARWLDCGFSFDMAEGFFSPAMDSATLLEFAPQLPKDLGDYVRFRAREDAERVFAETTPVLAGEELRQRLARWEEFARSNPQLIETRTEVRAAVESLAPLYFLGPFNFDLQTGRIHPDLIASWSRMDRQSRYGGLAAELVRRVKANDRKMTEKDRALFEPLGMGGEFENWWQVLQLRLKDR